MDCTGGGGGGGGGVFRVSGRKSGNWNGICAFSCPFLCFSRQHPDVHALPFFGPRMRSLADFATSHTAHTRHDLWDPSPHSLQTSALQSRIRFLVGLPPQQKHGEAHAPRHPTLPTRCQACGMIVDDTANPFRNLAISRQHPKVFPGSPPP